MNKQESNVQNIDEINFVRKLNQNPANLDAEMIEFLQKHPERKSTVKAAKEFDQQLLDVLLITPPEGLADKIMVKNSFSNQAANDPTWFSKLSLFVASFLVVLVGVWTWQQPSSLIDTQVETEQLAVLDTAVGSVVIEHILEHTIETKDELLPNQLAINDAELQKIFNFVGATLHKPIDTMTYAGGCVVNGQQGLHVVIEEDTGPVTVIVMPGKTLGEIQQFSKDGYIGNLIPVKGAVVAIVGKTEVQLAMAQMHFFKAVKFS